MKKIKVILSAILCLALVFSVVAPVYAESIPAENRSVNEDSFYMSKHTDVVIRSGPGTSYSKLGTLYLGDYVQVINRAEGTYGWSYILSKGIYGYVRNDLLS